MKLFRAEIDAHFWADDIEDALRKLAAHLVAMPDGEDSNLFVAPSHMDVRPEWDPEREQ